MQAGRSQLGRPRPRCRTQAGIRCLERRKRSWRGSPKCRRFRSTKPYTGAEGERELEGGEGRRRGSCIGTTAHPYRRRAIHHGLPMRTTTSTCGSGDFRDLHAHADDVNGGACCGFAGASYTSNVRNLDIDKVGAANSLIGAVMAIVVDRIKLLKTRVTSSGPSINQRGT